MSRNSEENWLVCYDIRDSRRLRSVHRLLKNNALPVQYSAFIFIGNPTSLQALVAELRERIDPRSDDVRCYHLGRRCPSWSLGQQSLPPGIMLDGIEIAALLGKASQEDED